MFNKVNHIGIVVKDVEQASKLWTDSYGLQAESTVIEGDMKIVMLHLGDILIELISPHGNEGVIAKFLDKKGEGVHHICFEVDDIRKTIKELSLKGLELIDKEPREGAEGSIAFIHPKSTHGVLTEMVQVR